MGFALLGPCVKRLVAFRKTLYGAVWVFVLSALNLPPKFLIYLFLRELLPSVTSEEPANQPTGSAQTRLSETLEPKYLHGLDLRFSNSWRHGPDPNRHSHSLRGQPVSYLCKPLFKINQTFYHIFIFSFVEKRAIRRN